jgi:exonuclease SbcC
MIEYIFHISDIHIKMENVTNLKNSFIQLIKDIVRTPNSILAIAGDIFELKTYLTTDEIYIFQWMLEALIKKNIRCIIIPGNHDYNINSIFIKNNIEVLTRHFKNIHCLSETQMFTLENIDFYVYSPIDKQIPNFTSGVKENIKVALVHEQVNDALYDNGERITGGRFNVAEFEKFDIAILGDIHKPQFLTETIAYSGSFIQKNKGEGLEHGYILWDLKTCRGKHVFIPLKEVFIKIEANNDDVIMPQLSEDQTIRYISLFYKNCSEEYMKTLKDDINNRYGIINKIVNKDIYNITDDIIQINEQEVEQTKNHYEVNQLELIKEILKDKSEDLITRICTYHSEKLQNRKEINYTQYRIQYLYWNNVFCYGEDNYVDFRNFKHNIVLLNGKNKQGKSTVIDILLRILFNEAERGYKVDIVNKHCKTGSIKLCFTIGEDVYIIQQHLTVEGKTNLHRLYKNGENITKHSIMETYKYIKFDLGIGDYRDFINLTTALQNRKFLIDLDQRELLTLLTKILNVDVLHDLEKETNSELSLLKRLNKKTIAEYSKLDKFTQENKDKVDKRLDVLNNRETIITDKLVTIANKMLELNRQYNNAKIPDGLDEKISHLRQRLEGLSSDIVSAEDIKKQIKDLEIEIEVLSGQPHHSFNADHISVGEFTNSDHARIEQLKSETNKPSKETLMYFKTNKINKDSLKQIANSREESDDYLRAQLHNFKHSPQYKTYKEISEIELNSVIDNYMTEYKKYKHFIETPLPNYTQIAEQYSILDKKIRNFKEKFGNIQYNDTCTCCNSNRSVMNNIVNITEEEHTLNQLRTILDQRDENESKMIKYKKIIEIIDCYNDEKIQRVLDARVHLKEYDNFIKFLQLNELIERRSKYVGKQIHIKKIELNNLGNNLLKLEEQAKLEQYIKLQKLQQSNEKISELLETIKISQIELSNKLKDIKTRRDGLLLESSLLDFNLKRKNELKIEQRTNIDQIEFLQYYYNCINHKNGIPSLILRNVSHLLDKRCNEILHQIADFEVEFIYDKEFKVYTCENSVKIPAVMGSGFQKFLLDMIMRITLTNISVLSNPNVIFIDEGFGCLDAENFIEVARILTKLKNNFDAMIIITHLQELKAYTDISIDIKIHNSFSYLKYGTLIKEEKFIEAPKTREPKQDSKKKKEKKDDGESKIDINLEGIDVKSLFEISDTEAACLGCKKILKRFGEKALVKHLNSKTLYKRHTKYISQIV